MTGRRDTARCIGEPVSWLRLELYYLDELSGPEHERIAQHLVACPACDACLSRVKDDEARALPPLTVGNPARRRGLSLFPGGAMASLGALAAAAALVLGIRGTGRPLVDTDGVARVAGNRVKGDAVAFSLVRDDAERIVGAEGVYRDGDRFKALVTCPPGGRVTFDVVVYERDTEVFPLEPAGDLACGNDVPLPGAFRLTGNAEETVCLVWNDGAAVDRTELGAFGRRAIAGGHAPGYPALCKQLSPASPRR